jgi:hypothetical protein
VWSFVWRKFSSVGKGEWWDEIKYGKKLNLGYAHVTPRNIQEVQASKLGDASRHPSSSAKIRSPFKTLYFYCFIYYAFFLEHLYFFFQFSFVLFAAINGWTPTNFFLRRHTPFFIVKNTLVFTFIVQRVFSFSSTAFSFLFCLDFCSDIVISLYQGAFRPMFYVGFHLKRVVMKMVWMVLEKRKSFMPIVVQMGACLDCGLNFCMSCLMLFW